MARLPLAYDLEIYCGTTFEALFRWLPGGSGSTGQDFTGWSAVLTIGSFGRTLTTLSTDDSTISLSATGQIIVSLPPARTTVMRPGTYSYSLDLTDADGRTIAFLRGRMEINAAVGG